MRFSVVAASLQLLELFEDRRKQLHLRFAAEVLAESFVLLSYEDHPASEGCGQIEEIGFQQTKCLLGPFQCLPIPPEIAQEHR